MGKIQNSKFENRMVWRAGAPGIQEIGRPGLCRVILDSSISNFEFRISRALRG
jgi:hypothetical protein